MSDSSISFDPSALMAVLDIPEMAGVPPELVEQLRGLVRRYDGGANYPVKIDSPGLVTIHQPLPTEGDSPWSRATYPANQRYEVTLEWPNGDVMTAGLLAVMEHVNAAGDRQSVGYEVGIAGRRFQFDLTGRQLMGVRM